MKIYFMLIAYAFLFISCESTDSEEALTELQHFSKIKNDIPPINNSNNYDLLGQVYQDVLLNYYAESVLPNSNDSIIATVNLKAHNHSFFGNLLPTEYDLLPESRIEYLALHGGTALDSLVANMPLSAKAKTDFSQFVASVLLQVANEDNYLEIYNNVVFYETTIQDSAQLTTVEKVNLLMVTSIIRHSVYARKKRPKKNTDLDWYWLTANFAGAIEGVQYGKEHTVLAALKSGIIENK